MATDTLPDFAVTPQWQDIVATVPGAAGVDLLIQHIGTGTIQLVQGGASAPSEGRSGLRLTAGQDAYANNAHIWVRSYSATGGLVSLNPL